MAIEIVILGRYGAMGLKNLKVLKTNNQFSCWQYFREILSSFIFLCEWGVYWNWQVLKQTNSYACVCLGTYKCIPPTVIHTYVYKCNSEAVQTKQANIDTNFLVVK